MPSRKGRADISPELRGGLRRAIKAMEQDGRPLSTIWLEMFEEDKFAAMRLAIQMMPKELDVTTTELSPEDWLELMAESRDVGQSESTRSENTVPGPVH